MAKGPDAVGGDFARGLVVRLQPGHCALEVVIVAVDLDKVLEAAAGLQEGVVVLDPVHLVGDDDGLAALQVLEAARVRVPLGVGEVLVLAVLGHGHEVVRHRLLVPPLHHLDVRPQPVRGRVQEILAQLQAHGRAAPKQLRCLSPPRPPVRLFRQGRLQLHLSHRSHLGLGPGPVPEIRHEPDVRVLGAPGVAPQGHRRDAVVCVEGEFDVWERFGRGDDGAMQGVEGGESAGINVACRRNHVELYPQVLRLATRLALFNRDTHLKRPPFSLERTRKLAKHTC